jgi:2-polyprenyl-6-methoxyphenol hydroxylase-like FAD-dependent oxidoreductase
LASVLADARSKGEDWSTKGVLKRYQKQRKLANSLMLHSMDAFHHGFSQTNTKTKWLRNLALASAKIPLIKQRVVRYAMGI